MKFSAIFFKIFCGTWLFAQGSFLEDKMIETTYLILDKGKWFEFFQDNTFSDNLMEWTDRTKFKLTFLESSNLEKKAFSRSGDEYDYEIISREENRYWRQSFPDEGSRFYVNFKV